MSRDKLTLEVHRTLTVVDIRRDGLWGGQVLIRLDQDGQQWWIGKGRELKLNLTYDVNIDPVRPKAPDPTPPRRSKTLKLCNAMAPSWEPDRVLCGGELSPFKLAGVLKCLRCGQEYE